MVGHKNNGSIRYGSVLMDLPAPEIEPEGNRAISFKIMIDYFLDHVLPQG